MPPGNTPENRDSNYRALVRDVILGSAAVIFVSLAVPTWILRAEYRKTYGAPVKLAPAADVLRERTAGTALTPSPPPHILELAEQLVRREAERREIERREQREAARREVEKRETERREAARREAESLKTAHSPITHTIEVPVGPAAARPAQAVAPVVNTPQFDFRESVQSP